MCFRSRIRRIVSNICCEFHDSNKNSHMNDYDDGESDSDSGNIGLRRYGSAAHYSILLSLLLWQVLLTLLQQTSPAAFVHAASGGSVSKGFADRIRAVKIAGTPKVMNLGNGNVSTTTTQGQPASNATPSGKYEIHGVSGEPNYKSVNLSWEVELVPSSLPTSGKDVGAEVEPPKAFQIFFCELQSFGPHRCRSKLVNETQHQESTEYNNNNFDNNNEVEEIKAAPGAKKHNRQLRHYAVQIDNLRMATKYSFHIRPQMKRRNMKITGRSELFGNEIDDELQGVPVSGGQTIIIPTKGFSAQATKCLPHASEIEVETGPYFGGKIVVDGGNCGVKGDPDDSIDRYTMRIDHKLCGSLVKPETNTVETFITVQENLGIYTHSTRRFVVVCSFQSGMQTVRASFTVPSSDGVAAAVENDPFEPDDRLGREQRQMRYVDKSALVLKEHETSTIPSNTSEESEAFVREVTEAVTINSDKNERNSPPDVSTDAENTVAVLEDIIADENEARIKHENEILKMSTSVNERRHPIETLLPVAHARMAKYAKLVSEEQVVNVNVAKEEDELLVDEEARQWYGLRNNDEEKAYLSTVKYITANSGGVLLTVSISVIILGIFIIIVYREARRQRSIRSSIKMQHLNSPASGASSNSSSLSTTPIAPTSSPAKLHVKHTIPRSLQPQHPQGTI